MYQTLPELLASECTEKVTTPPPSEQHSGDTEADSFLDLLADAEQYNGNRSDVIARYRAWIGRNSAASAPLYGAWFNLGVELAAAGNKAGAINAYQNALTLRPGFYPAAINLGTLLEAAGQPESALAIWQQALQPEEARAALLDYRDRLTEACRIAQDTAKVLLHIGCTDGHEELPTVFRNPGWREIRPDIDPAVRPDFVASMTDLRGVSDGAVDAVYSPHAINHLCPHEVPLALQAMHRVLKPAGFAFITLPDLQEVARYVAEGKLEDPLYMSPAGPITPLGILYGHHQPSVASAHASATPRTGFTGVTLAAALIKAGFAAVMVQREPSAVALTAIAFRNKPDKEQLIRAQARTLPAAGHPAMLYTAAA